ncbi:hypothetical protein [Actinoplanes xinjiangensis]|uniref:SurA-like protein n=1 Tax=Actinoplanes xinjiangensis TaxID=512350 RepID=A0A316F7P3_9ACTN|nr:hypothetical protein [Actinoplanes xinjiangensis]PWK40818.1 hypothetical protein BC793_11847 [Actinoplanes xinjiangensis]GIF43330.1 hypothetical protein Axi01nite_76410 [Actinoplanes xinjiangensis]
MLRARRLASAVVAASLAVGGLSACRSESSVAAYMGSAGEITEQELDKVWNEAYDTLTDQARAEAAEAEKAQRETEKKREEAGEEVTPAPTITAERAQVPFTRTQVLQALVGHEIYARLADKHAVRLPADVPYEQFAAEKKLPADSTYAKLYIENYYLRGLLTQSLVSTATPTDQDMRFVYDQLTANGGVEPGQDYATWRSAQGEQNLQAVAAAARLREEVRATADELRVKLNPRYAFDLTVLGVEGETGALDLLTADFDDRWSVPVADAS